MILSYSWQRMRCKIFRVLDELNCCPYIDFTFTAIPLVSSVEVASIWPSRTERHQEATTYLIYSFLRTSLNFPLLVPIQIDLFPPRQIDLAWYYNQTTWFAHFTLGLALFSTHAFPKWRHSKPIKKRTSLCWATLPEALSSLKRASKRLRQRRL